MKSLLFIALLGLAPALLAEPTSAPAAAPTPTPAPATSRSRALELAGAFANDGYKIRDGFWSGTLEPGKPLFVEVNLVSGNEYWFSTAALSPARKVSVDIFDQKGRPIQGERFQDGPTAAAGLIAQTSGHYFVRVSLTEGEKADCCLVYSYK